MKTRVRAIIIEGSKILLIHRNKNGEEYWVFPGGGVDKGETPEIAMLREALEELGVSVDVGQQFAIHELNLEGKEPQQEIFFFCSITGGKLGTGNGPEFQEGTSYIGEYALEWVPFAEISRRRVMPEAMKTKLLKEVIDNENAIVERT